MSTLFVTLFHCYSPCFPIPHYRHNACVGNLVAFKYGCSGFCGTQVPPSLVVHFYHCQSLNMDERGSWLDLNSWRCLESMSQRRAPMCTEFLYFIFASRHRRRIRRRAAMPRSPGRLTSRVTQMHIHETPIDEKIVRSDAWVCDRRRVSFIKPPAECRRFSALFID